MVRFRGAWFVDKPISKQTNHAPRIEGLFQKPCVNQRLQGGGFVVGRAEGI